MIKFRKQGRTGATIVGLGLSEENLKRLKNDDPIYIHLDELGIEGIDVTIFYGKEIDSVTAKLQEKGFTV